MSTSPSDSIGIDATLQSWKESEELVTFTGKRVRPLALEERLVDIVDIAHALAHLCRFNGHCQQFYSVAEHCVRVSERLPPALRLWGLMHDAAEAYLVDLPRAVKISRGLGDFYRIAEHQAMQTIATRFGLPWPEPPEVKVADRALLELELRDLLPAGAPENAAREVLGDRIEPWAPDRARARFLDQFERLKETEQAR